MKNNSFFEKHKNILLPIISVILAFLVGTIIIGLAGYNIADSYGAFIKGSIGTPRNLGNTLNVAVPLIFTGLGMAFTNKIGLFNIGLEGQFIIGAVTTALIGGVLPEGMTPLIGVPILIIVGAMAGAIWGAIPGMLRAYRGVHEVITTIMMNYIAVALTAYLIFIFKTGDIVQTPKMTEGIRLSYLKNSFTFLGNSKLTYGIFIAIIAAIVLYIIFKKTVLGYEITAIGLNESASENIGIKVKKNLFAALTISGLLAGLGGAVTVLGQQYGYYQEGIAPQVGFIGIAVALLANNNPIGIIASAFLFGILSTGSLSMSTVAEVPVSIGIIIQSLVIFSVAATFLIKSGILKTSSLFKGGKVENGSK